MKGTIGFVTLVFSAMVCTSACAAAEVERLSDLTLTALAFTFNKDFQEHVLRVSGTVFNPATRMRPLQGRKTLSAFASF